MESIQQLPGVISTDETAANLIVRGGRVDQNRVIWDGINIYQTGHLFGMISVFNPNVPSKLSFYNQGTNPKFGERISSVIDISTSDFILKKSNFQYGTNMLNSDFVIGIPISDKLSIQSSYRRSFEDILETSTIENYENKVFQKINHGDEFFKFQDYNLKINYKPNNNNGLYISFIHIDNDFHNDYKKNTTSILYQDNLEAENNGLGMKWKHQWNDKIEQTTKFSWSDYQFEYHFIQFLNTNFISDFSKQNSISDWGLSTEFNQKISSEKKWEYGYQIRSQNVGFIFKEKKDILYILDNNISKINTHALYLNYSERFLKKYQLNSGVRLNYYDKLNTFHWEPRLNFTIDLNKHLKIQLTGEIKHQIISQIDETVLSNLSLENKLWRLADGQDYPIIEGKQLSTGITYLKNNWTFDLSLYKKNINELSALSLGFLNPDDNSVHIGKNKINGADLYIKKKFKPFDLWLTYSFLDSKTIPS